LGGIVGVFHRDGRPVDSQVLNRMAEAVLHRGPDTGRIWADGSVGLGYRILLTTPEAGSEAHSLEDRPREFFLAMDGRVDNREELTTLLAGDGYRLRDGTDAELVLRSYEAWGDECASRIIGDFSFAIWDGRRRRLYCARDFYGSRSFYYCHDGRSFLFASEIHALFESPEVPRKPNLGMVGEYLHGYINSQTESLYEDIFRLPAAHYLIVDANGVRLQRYWGEDVGFTIRYRKDEEYAEHFQELLRESLRSRMRCIGTLGSDLSGGLDSSSVVCFSQSLLREGTVRCDGFEVFSQVYPGQDCDESRYIRDVVSKCGIVSHEIEPQPVSLEFLIEQVRFYKDFPGYPNGSITNPLRPMMRERGCRVVFTGQGGDEWFSGTDGHYLDLLLQMRWLRLAGAMPPALGVQVMWRLLLGHLLWPRVPKHLRRGIRTVLGRPVMAPWIGKDFAKRVGLEDRLETPRFQPQRGGYSQQELHSPLADGWNAHASDLEDRAMGWYGLERRMPLFDRRIAEFGLAVPEEQRYRNGLHKYVMRQALRNLLPESVRIRPDKADFSWLFVNQFRALGDAGLFNQLELAKNGYVDLNEIRAKYHQIEDLAKLDLHNSWSYVWRLWMVWGLELWWRELFAGK